MSDKNRGQVLVLIQFVLLIALVATPHGNMWFVSEVLGNLAVIVMMIGLSITLFGIVSLGNSLTATPVPKKQAVLRTRGMYALVRHPIYLGLLMLGFGLTVPSGSLFTVIVYILLAFLLSYKARFEERMLLEKFPEYLTYASRVGRIIPFIGRIRPTR